MRSIFLIVLFFCVFISFSQNKIKDVDSLSIILHSKENDSLKFKKIINLVQYYQGFNLSESQRYLNTAFVLFKKNKSDYMTVEFYAFKAREKLLSSDYNEALTISNKLKRFCSGKKKLEEGYLRACYVESFVYMATNKFEKSISFLEDVVKRYKNTKYFERIGILYHSLGRYYSIMDNEHRAIYNFQLAIKNFKKADSHLGLYQAYFALCEQYLKIKNIKGASYHLKLMRELKEVKLTKRDLYFEYYLEAELRFLQKKFEESSLLCKKQLALNDEMFDFPNRTTIISRLCKVLLAQKKNSEVISLCQKELSRPLYDFFSEYSLYFNLSKAYYKEKDYHTAKKYFKKTQSLFDKFNLSKASQYDVNDFYLLGSKLEASLGNYSRAYYFQDKYIESNNKLLTNKNAEKIHELQAIYESNEKESKIKEISLQNQKKDVVLERNRLSLIIGGLSLIFSIFVIVFLYWIYKKNKRFSKLLSSKNQIIENKNKELSESREIILISLSEKDLLLKEIHHRVKNNLQLMISLLNIQARENVTNISDFVSKSQSRITSMALIHQNLYETDKLNAVDFGIYIEKLVRNIEETFQEQSRIDVFVEVQNVFLDIQTSIPLGLIINELVTNAFKHAFPDKHQHGEVLIRLKNINENIYELTIKDNGVGNKKNVSFKKTLGLELVELLTIQINGELFISNENGAHYKIVFRS